MKLANKKLSSKKKGLEKVTFRCLAKTFFFGFFK